MEMTEQGKAMAEVTFTITESTPSGNSYLKYWGERGTSPPVPLPTVRTPCPASPAPHLRLRRRGIEGEGFIGPGESGEGGMRAGRGSIHPGRERAGGRGRAPHRSTKFSTRVTRSW